MNEFDITKPKRVARFLIIIILVTAFFCTAFMVLGTTLSRADATKEYDSKNISLSTPTITYFTPATSIEMPIYTATLDLSTVIPTITDTPTVTPFPTKESVKNEGLYTILDAAVRCNDSELEELSLRIKDRRVSSWEGSFVMNVYQDTGDSHYFALIDTNGNGNSDVVIRLPRYVAKTLVSGEVITFSGVIVGVFDSDGVYVMLDNVIFH